MTKTTKQIVTEIAKQMDAARNLGHIKRYVQLQARMARVLDAARKR
jgi:hypothetical protein